MTNRTGFAKDLQHIVNTNSMDTLTNTPDFILSDFLANVTYLFATAMDTRTLTGHGRCKAKHQYGDVVLQCMMVGHIIEVPHIAYPEDMLPTFWYDTSEYALLTP